MNFIKLILKIIIGIVFGISAVVALSPAFAAFTSDQDNIAQAIMLALIPIVALLCLFAPTVRRAFGRGFLVLGASVFALPISTFLLSGRAANEVIGTADQGSEALAAVGAGMAGVAITGVATFIGLIIGSILIIIGLVLSLGGRREVIVVSGNE